MSSAICFNLDQFKILSSGNGLKVRGLCGEHWTDNSLSNAEFLNTAKFRAFAKDKLHVFWIQFFVFDQLESIVGRGENADLLLRGY